MDKTGSRFNKPGRPREDAVERRLEIYERVAPLLVDRGMRGLSMREAARAAHVSVGTLYHYFPNKRALVLYGINPEPAELVCARFAERHAHLADPHALRPALVGLVVETVQLMRASIDAAIQLGPDAIRDQLDEVAKHPLRGFPALIERAMSPDDARTPAQVEQMVRRTVVSALMEKELAPDELRAVLDRLIAGR